MKTLLAHFLRILLMLRYRIRIVGLKELNALHKDRASSQGILFLANHPAEIDPVILMSILWPHFRPHPVVMMDFFYKFFVRDLLRIAGAVPVPTFDEHSNSYKQKAIQKTYSQIYSLLEKGENLLIYPAGGLKSQAEEIIGGASGIKTILENKPDTPIVLIKTTGLWGSQFSRALIGKSPDLGKTFFKSFLQLLKNFVFFMPRRQLSLEFAVPKDFPQDKSRLEINRYLENFYNSEVEPLSLVSYSFWRKDLPKITTKGKETKKEIVLPDVEATVRPKILDELARMSHRSSNEIDPAMNLSTDLGLDSLDIAQITLFLKEEFGVSGISSAHLILVHDVIAYAAGERKPDENEEEKLFPQRKEESGRPLPFSPKGMTIMEAFLNTCSKMGNFTACGDQLTEFQSYKKCKRRVLLFMEMIKSFPEERIGIMLPASVAVNYLILGTLFAKKVPVMINWTLGSKNQKAVINNSGISHTLSSYQFLNRLDNVDLNGIDETIVLLEELRFKVTPKAILKAFFLSLLPSKWLIKILGFDRMIGHETAVILYTSGTESIPKGVPLTHNNLLTNVRDAYSQAEMKNNDLLLGVLPPFHSFGFLVNALVPYLAGICIAYLPNPTDGRRIARAIDKWRVTFLCLAPTFLKNILRVATEPQLKTLRLVVSGAEKMSLELKEKFKSLNPQTILAEGYGITECSPILTLTPLKGKSKGVGLPLPSVELLIVNPETKEVITQGKDGLILAHGPNVFSGYLDKSIPSPFIELQGKSWYQTGDLGMIDEGFLVLSGRLKRFVKIGGEMVSLGAIEEALVSRGKKRGWPISDEQPSIAVIASENDDKRAEIVLFTTLSVMIDEVNTLIREEGLSNLSRISKIVKVPSIPLLGTGKIDYRMMTSQLKGVKS